jgi:nucleotide-binding universal stress UspA family protein
VSGYYAEEVHRETRVSELEYLQRTAARWMKDSAVVIRPFCLDAPVSEALAQHVDEHDIELVIMTTHGRGGLSRAWLGSVADRLVRTVDIPVLLYRPTARSADCAQRVPLRILVPLDGSGISESILQEAIEIGAVYDATYVLMQVVAPPIFASADATLKFETDASAMRREAIDYLNHQAAIMRARGLSVETRVIVQGNTASGIIEEAAESKCDLIAMATHGRSGWSRIALGSVADKVLRTAPIPLLVMKPAAAVVGR